MIRIPRTSIAFSALLIAYLLLPRASYADGFAWDDSICTTGGSWLSAECWGGQYPNSNEAGVLISLEEPGSVFIPTSSLIGITVNTLNIDSKVDLFVNDNTTLGFQPAANDNQPLLYLDSILTIQSPTIGGSSLRALNSPDPEKAAEFLIIGAGEIRLGAAAALESETRAEIILSGGIEVATQASTASPAVIDATLTNSGGEIRVLGGPLIMDGDIKNTGGGFVEVYDQFGSGSSELRLEGKLHGGTLYPGLGVVRIFGGELADILVEAGAIEIAGIGTFGGNVELTKNVIVDVLPGHILGISNSATAGSYAVENHGLINLGDAAGGANLRNTGSITTIDGPGELVLRHPGSQLTTTAGGTIHNGAQHTIRGGGGVLCNLWNEGELIADSAKMTFFNPVTGPTGDISVVGDPANPGTAEARASISTRNLRVGPNGKLVVTTGWTLSLYGSYFLETQVESASSWYSGTQIVFQGGGALQAMEAASTDQGATNGGFSVNFGIPRFVISTAGTQVYLRDQADNGNRLGGLEAVYVTTLEVLPGTTLDLNGICMYTKIDGNPYRVQAGDGALFGGGTIVDDGSIVSGIGVAVPRPRPFVAVAPSPFNPATEITFQGRAGALTTVKVFDARGRLVARLHEGVASGMAESIKWNAADLHSGVYFVQVSSGGEAVTRKTVLVK